MAWAESEQRPEQVGCCSVGWQGIRAGGLRVVGLAALARSGAPALFAGRVSSFCAIFRGGS